MSNCPLCEQEIKKSKVVYGHTICKKCWAGYINRRQIAYIIDTLIVMAAMLFVGFVSLLIFGSDGVWIQFFVNVLLNVYWLGRDGFSGRSPGKVAMNIEAVDNVSGAAIGWKQAFLRNWPFAISNAIILVAQFFEMVDMREDADVALLPLALSGFLVLVALITFLVMAFQINKGPRWGDGLANTRVIWRRYAESPVFNPTLAQSLAAPPEFAPAIRSDASESTNDPYRAPRS